MRYLKPEHWKRFDAPPKGRMFEDLVEVILPSIHPGDWVRTKASWDRARDFVLRLEHESVCAECKIYHERLSLQVLSKTLVMAIVDDFSRILLFSYSALNENTLTHLTQFQGQTGRKIEVYDDEKLERIILGSRKALSFFDFVPTAEEPAGPRIAVIDHMSRDPEVDYLDMVHTMRRGGGDAGLKYLQLFETISFDIVVINESLDEISGRIVLDRDSFQQNFRLLDREVAANGHAIDFTLAKAGAWTKRLYFKAIRPGDGVPLPKYDVVAGDAEVIQRGSDYRLKVSSLLRPPLVGKQHLDIERRFREAISLREQSAVFLVQGPSGTGKSRLLAEMRDAVFEQGFMPFRYSAEGNETAAFDHFIRKFIAGRFKLPLAVPADEPPSDAPAEKPVSPLARVLYDRSFRPSEHEAECIELFFNAIEGQRIAILLDDIQALDPATIRLLNEFLTRTRGTRGRLALLMTANTDYLTPASPQAAFAGRVKDLADADSSPAPQFASASLSEFSPEDARTYLDHCFADDETIDRPLSIRLPKTVDLFLDQVPLTPLFIEQFLLALEDAGALERRNQSLYVRDLDLLHRQLHDVPKKIGSVIGRRWDHLKGRVGEAVEHGVRVLTFFVFLPVRQIDRFEIDAQAVDALVDAGFFEVDARENLVFHHQTFFRYFKDVIRPFERSFAARMLEAADRTARSDAAAQLFLASDSVGCLGTAEAAYAVEAVESDAARVEYLVEFADAFARTAPVFTDLDAGRILAALRVLAGRLKARIGFEESSHFQAEVERRELRRLDRYAGHGYEYCDLAISIAGIHVSVRRDWLSLPVLEQVLANFDQLKFPSDQLRVDAHCSLLNRRCVALRSLSRREEAIRVGRTALEEARAGGLPYLEMQSHIDLGYIFYGRLADRAELVEQWSTAVRLIVPEAIPPSFVTGANVWRYHSVHVATLEGKFDDALLAAGDAAARASTELDTFHQVKLLLMRVVIELMRPAPTCDYRELRATTDRVLDLCIRYNARQTYWMAYWALAKIAERQGLHDAMRTNVLQAFEQLLAFIGSQSEMQQRFHEPLTDLAITARKAGGQLPDDAIALIESPTVRSELRSILAMPDAKFGDFCTGHRPATTYHDGRFDLPCP